MSRGEREAFLAGTHVAVISVERAGRAPLSVPVWYRYEPGGKIRFVTGGSSTKAALIREAGRITLCAQSETPPYRYVTVEGPAVIEGEPDFERDVREVALRYLGDELGELYLQMTADERAGNVAVVLTPERWTSVDYNKMGAAG